MKNGFVKVAAGAPGICVADPAHNAKELIALAHTACEIGVRVLTFPELALTGSTCGDLFLSHTLLEGAKKALQTYLEETRELDLISVVGLPIRYQNQLFSCAAVCQSGALLGLVPKQMKGNGRCTFSDYELLPFLGELVPFGSDLLFACEELESLKLAVVIGSDRDLPLSPAIAATAAGATLICNPSATPELIGAEDYRTRTLLTDSARLSCAYLCAEAGSGESTTDQVYGGHRIVAENGKLLAEDPPFSGKALTVTEIDTELLVQERLRRESDPSVDVRFWELPFSLSPQDTELTRPMDPHPFIPADPTERAARCERILTIQTEGLKQRIVRAYAKKIVVGISGGLDSTLALLVMARAMDALDRPRTDILAVTMPCFGTTVRTKNNATVLCEELGVEFRQVDIFDAVNQHFADIGHDPAIRDVTYENSQARERTQILMDIANEVGGMVIGTGDLSELALGWATYNGDHMSMYGVNADIPKTLIRHLVSYCADVFDAKGYGAIATALRDVLDTPVSPELLPADEQGEIAQKTEDLVGPYEIHDFYLYYLLRYGFSPKKLFRMAEHALGDRYDRETLLKWLKVFLRRFFNQQFKRSCLPDGPAVGSIGLSPRGAWAMPSDASSALWLAEAEEI